MDENSLGDPEDRPRREVSGSGSVRFEATFARATGDHDPLPPPEFREVRSLAGQQMAIDDAMLRFTSLELWSTLAVIRYSYSWAPRFRTRLRRLAWSATDDAGTVYGVSTTLGAGASHLDRLLLDDRVVEPAPPPEATVLTLVASDGESEFAAELPL